MKPARRSQAHLMIIFMLAMLVQSSDVPAAGPAQPSSAKIVLYRSGTMLASVVPCVIRSADRELVNLSRAEFAEWIVPAGDHVLTSRTNTIHVEVLAGQTAYVQCTMTQGFPAKAHLRIVAAEEDFDNHGASYQQRDVAAPREPAKF